jgi:hypothetical protein
MKTIFNRRRQRSTSRGCYQLVCDAEWALVAPYLTLMTEDAPQAIFLRIHRLLAEKAARATLAVRPGTT